MILLLLLYPAISASKNALSRFPELNNAGVLFLDTQGQPIISTRSKTAFIPASTTKLVTAWLALTHWGEDHHFSTEFYFDTATKTLWVKASGDPFLVSEELALITQNLSQLGLRNIDAIGLDVSLFEPNLVVPGSGKSNNPYDAIPTALAANFNTVAIKKIAGKTVSAESQTPLTPFAKSFTKQLSAQKTRINTGRISQNAEQYFAELLAAFLRQQGISVPKQVIWGKAPQQPVYYTHVNSKSLGNMIRPMLKYSTNFIANQLILMLSAESYHRPANFVDVQNYMEESLRKQFSWQVFTMKDGAGLSRENRLSPEQLVQLLGAFKPWKHLLPEVTPGVYAKSGTLNKVSTLAGYVVNIKQQWQPFALMMKQSVSHRRRNLIARKLANK